MRCAAILVLALSAVLPSGVRAEEPAAVICDDLVSLRRLMAEAPDKATAKEHLSGHPACRAVEPGRIGEVERRAMIGGAPFECVRVGQSACAWLLP